MESRVKLFGHPIHPMLIVFPLGLLAAGVIFDVVYLITGNGHFSITAFWMITSGLIGGLLAAIFGFLDWLAIPGNTRAKQIGLWHGGGNAVIVVLFALSWFLRLRVDDFVPSTFALILELLGAGLALITGWLGGELVYRLRMGVDDGAHLNAPSSLSDQPAGQGVQSSSASRQARR
jgi:uncharacterized membrane protein